MIKLYHMSKDKFSTGDAIFGTDRDKVDPRIEEAFERFRPTGYLSRREAVFCRDDADFHRCGIDGGYIYTVSSKNALQVHDLSWLQFPQKALSKQKYKDPFPFGMANYPDWNEKLLKDCSTSYWSGESTEDPVWEYLLPSAIVCEVLSTTIIDARDTAGGWRD
mgnify:CR=1 FL=1